MASRGKRRMTELLTAQNIPGIERSHTSAMGALPNNSNIGSFAAHKVNKNDMTNASHQQMGWLDEPIGKQRRAQNTKPSGNQLDLSDLNIQRQQTQVRGRKSIFVPKKASLRAHTKLEVNDGANIALAGNSDDEEDDSKTSSKQADRYNLLHYNEDRKHRLNEFDYSHDVTNDEEEDNFDKQVLLANKLKLNCFGNLEISLFWEEKLVVLIRTAQLYSIIFFFYYEQWPSNTRKNMTIMFSSFTGSLYIQNQEDFYDFMQNLELLEYVVAGTFLVNLFLATLGLILTCKKSLRYRLEFMSNSCNIYRFYFWFMEIMFVPLLLNVSWPASCKFWSERDAITFIDCTEDGDTYYFALKAIMIGSYLMALLYNVQLFGYIYKNKISTQFHEQAVEKKEVEYSYGINKLWSTEKFFTFSSFKSGVGSIYHRIIFNMFAVCFIAVNALQNKADKEDLQLTISIHTLITIIFTIHVIMTRPYRNFSTNLLYILCMLAFLTMMVMMYMKLQGYKQSVFIDKYFFLLTIFLSGFLWFIVLTWILFIFITRQKWGLDKETVMERTEGQDLAIYYIKDARQFIVYLIAKKKYTEEDAVRMEQLIENLTMQFNQFRGTQPLIMDSLLETIDSLRLIQRNYEQDPELFNFDYKEDLVVMARERERVFSLSKFSTLDTQDQEETQSNIYSRIYGVQGGAGGRKETFGEGTGTGTYGQDDESEMGYAEPPRERYPEDRGIVNNFASVARSGRSFHNPDQIEMQFSR